MGKITGVNTWTGSVGIDHAHLEMMPDTVIFHAADSIDVYGRETYSPTDVTVRCRIQYDSMLLKNDQGQDIVAQGKIYLYGDYSTLNLHHQLTLPDGRKPIIVKVESKKDTANAVHHTIVYFGL